MISVIIPWVVGILLLGVFHSAGVDDGLMNIMIGAVVVTYCERRLGGEQRSETVLYRDRLPVRAINNLTNCF